MASFWKEKLPTTANGLALKPATFFARDHEQVEHSLEIDGRFFGPVIGVRLVICRIWRTRMKHAQDVFRRYPDVQLFVKNVNQDWIDFKVPSYFDLCRLEVVPLELQRNRKQQDRSKGIAAGRPWQSMSSSRARETG